MIVVVTKLDMEEKENLGEIFGLRIEISRLCAAL
jgi:hypothetical protein